MSARVRDGWLLVDYAGPEMATIEVGVGRNEAEVWRPAFLDWVDGKRVAKVRPYAGDRPVVWLRVNGNSARVGKAT